MKTMYRAHSEKPGIEAVEIIRETAHFVTHTAGYFTGWNVGREIKQRKEGQFFNSWQECKNLHVTNLKAAVKQTKSDLQDYRSKLGSWESLKEPK